MFGFSKRHGATNDAQKLTRTNLPRRSDNLYDFVLSVERKLISGAISPTFGGVANFFSAGSFCSKWIFPNPKIKVKLKSIIPDFNNVLIIYCVYPMLTAKNSKFNV